jgi:hypothetical protein
MQSLGLCWADLHRDIRVTVLKPQVQRTSMNKMTQPHLFGMEVTNPARSYPL